MPALPQTVTGPGIATKVARPIPFAGRDWEGDLKKLTDESDAKTTAMTAAHEAERAPLAEALTQSATSLDSEANTPVNLKPLPENKAAHLDPKQINEAASIWMTLGAFAGLLTRQPMTAALGNMTAAMKGAIEGDDVQFKQNVELWDKNFKAAMAANKQMLDEKREVMENKRMSLVAKEAMLRHIDVKNGAQAQVLQHSIHDRFQAFDQQMKMHEQAQASADRLYEQAQARIQRHDDSVRHDQLMVELAKIKADAKGSGTMGQREMAFAQRVLGASNQAARVLANVVQLPIESTTGVFGDKQPGVSMLTAPGNVLARQLTPQEAQTYQVMATGIQRNLAAIETMGLAPPGTLTHQMESVILKEGDTNLTKMHKLADIRQIIESGMETMATNPRVPDDMRKLIDRIGASVKESVPFTQSDVIGFNQALKSNPHETLGAYMKRAGSKPAESAVSADDEALIRKHLTK